MSLPENLGISLTRRGLSEPEFRGEEHAAIVKPAADGVATGSEFRKLHQLAAACVEDMYAAWEVVPLRAACSEGEEGAIRGPSETCDERHEADFYFTGGEANVVGAEESIAGGFSLTGPFGFTIAFLAGIIAFLSPCVLPMVPAYVMHLAGVSTNTVGDQRWQTFRHSIAFVLGFSLIFVALGASVGAVGFLIRDNILLIQKFAGVMLIILGLNLLGILKIPWLYRTYQVDFGSNTPAQSGS